MAASANYICIQNCVDAMITNTFDSYSNYNMCIPGL